MSPAQAAQILDLAAVYVEPTPRANVLYADMRRAWLECRGTERIYAMHRAMQEVLNRRTEITEQEDAAIRAAWLGGGA